MREKQRDLSPIGSCILVRLRSEKVSKGGIVLATEFDKRQRTATEEAYIVEIGSEAFKEFKNPQCVKTGDLVKISKYAGTDDDTTIEAGQTYRMISDADILGLYKGEEYHD